MSSPELDALLVSNLADLEAAISRIDELDKEVFAEVDRIAEEWAEKASWNGSYDFMDGKLWLAPPDWHKADDDEQIGQFELVYADSQKEAEFHSHIAYLCQIGKGKVQFDFKQRLTTKNAAWKRFVRENINLLENTPFNIDSYGDLSLPIAINADELATALREQSIADALGPFRVALDQLKVSQPAFDRLLEAARASKL